MDIHDITHNHKGGYDYLFGEKVKMHVHIENLSHSYNVIGLRNPKGCSICSLLKLCIEEL